MPKPLATTPERSRLEEDARREKNWTRWGPYLSERQWGTVREDYSPDGQPWGYFTHEQARSRAYRWGEDGLLGITDRECRLCFALALWNGRDPFLKERLFGLTGPEGNHGEDVKECYFYLDATPTGSWLKALYKYPQAAFPYQRLRDENHRRGRSEPEFEILDSNAFDEERYFDVLVKYAKASPDDILIQVEITNRGPDFARLHVLPTLWFRNTWAWGSNNESPNKPSIRRVSDSRVRCEHETLGQFYFDVDSAVESGSGTPRWLFTENETNAEKLFAAENRTDFVKDAFHETVVNGNRAATNPAGEGTKTAAWHALALRPQETRILRMRLHAKAENVGEVFGPTFAATLSNREAEADEFYAAVSGKSLPSGKSVNSEQELAAVSRQAYAGLLWSKQFYHYIVKDWLDGDPLQPRPPPERNNGRNADWRHLYSRDIISMPDKWEYPWFAAWDLAFHMVPMATVDPDFAKKQLNLVLREWYMHPNGQLPAYEWDFSDVNPPVHAWACWRVYKISATRGSRDRTWLARVFQKLMLNFTWWVNRKDPDGRHLFSGGFLGLDNIGVFDRSKPLPGGGSLAQADGTAWMAFYSGTMLSIALELADGDPAYEDIASKFFEHFIAIADAMNRLGGSGLWHEADGFYYDQVKIDGETMPVRLRSMVGIIPLFAVELIEQRQLLKLPGFAKRTRWVLEHRPDIAAQISYLEKKEGCGHFLLAIPSRERLERMLKLVLAETEFLSPFGVRSLSQAYRDHPFTLSARGVEWRVAYCPGESDTGLFGGNSNWRGPIWIPLNYLLIEALERYYHFYGDSLTVELPTGSGRRMTLKDVGAELSRRILSLFARNSGGRSPAMGMDPRFVTDLQWRDLHLFYEYFHAETGQGLGASHQTGWTALVTRLIEGERA
jgi:hypothetical protein